MTVTGFLVPLVLALVPLAGQGYGSSHRFPPISCIAVSLNAIVYPLFLPAAVIGVPGVCLLVGVFWNIIKVRTP